MTIPAYDALTLAAFFLLGAWLDGAGGKDGLIDRALTRAPMTALGLVYLALRHL